MREHLLLTLEEKLADFDVHIMAANPVGEWAGWPCEQGCNDDPQNCSEYGYQCHVYAKSITPCDSTLAAGLTFNAGGGAADRHCELFGGNRYIVSGEPEMNDALECIARVGWSGGVPPMGDALIAALDPKINAEGGCNAGFLRDDALLVVVLINDTEDTESTSWPYQQYEAVVDAKDGDPNAIVALAVTPQPMVDPDQTCSWNNDRDAKVRDLIYKFPYHYEGDTCAPATPRSSTGPAPRRGQAGGHHGHQDGARQPGPEHDDRGAEDAPAGVQRRHRPGAPRT